MKYEKELDKVERNMREIEEQRDTELENALARMDREYQQRQQNLANLAIMLSRISPASAMAQATMGFADTGLGNFDHFIRSAQAYRERYIAFLKEKGIPLGFIIYNINEDRKLEKPNMNEIPVFQYKKMSLASVVQKTIVDILLLVLLCLLLFIGTYVSFLKYDVR